MGPQTSVIVEFIRTYRHRFGVESICETLTINRPDRSTQDTMKRVDEILGAALFGFYIGGELVLVDSEHLSRQLVSVLVPALADESGSAWPTRRSPWRIGTVGTGVLGSWCRWYHLAGTTWPGPPGRDIGTNSIYSPVHGQKEMEKLFLSLA